MLYFSIFLILIASSLIFVSISQKIKFYNLNMINQCEKQSNFEEFCKSLRQTKQFGSVPNEFKYLKNIKSSYKFICKKVNEDKEIFAFERLLYENYHNILAKFNKNQLKQLAVLPHCFGKTRIILICEYFLNKCNFCVSKENFCKFILEFNKFTPLETDEINCLGIALKYLFFKKTSEIAQKAKQFDLQKQLAFEEKFKNNFENEDCYLYYRSKAGYLQNDTKNMQNFNGNILNIEYTFTQNLSRLLNNINNIIKSINIVNKEFSSDFLLVLNNTNSLLENDSTYKTMDIKSKFQYLNSIKRLAQKNKISESHLVKKVFELQEKTNKHFGIFLFEETSTIKFFIKDNMILPYKKGTQTKQTIFTFCVWFAVFATTALLGLLTFNIKPLFWATIFLMPFALLPLINNLAIKFISLFISSKPSPKLELKEIPDDGKTLVVLPVFISNKNSLMDSIEKIKEIQATGAENNVNFALLIDYKASKTQTDMQDLQFNKILFNNLSSYQNINVFVRNRIKNGKIFSGFEKKRGAIMDLCDCLITGNKDNFSYILREDIFVPKFIITLDEDNCILPNSIHNAICTMLHPLNKNYDLMTFKSRYNLYSIDTLYAKKYYNDCGYTRYSSTNSFYYNYFGKGIFNGKGIFDLHSFYSKLKDIFPSNKVLSHDIIEGAILNTGELDCCIFENAPTSLQSELTRQNRWLKGDILLAKFLRKKVSNDQNKKNKINKEIIYNHIILLNIFSGIATISKFIFLIMACFFANLISFVPFIILFFVPLFVSILQTINGTRHNIKIRYVISSLVQIICDFVLNFFALPIRAVNNFFVILNAIYCLIFKNVNALKWITFKDTQNKNNFKTYLKSTIFPVLMLATLSVIFSSNIFVLAYTSTSIAVILGLYLMGFKQDEKSKISQNDEDFLKNIAQKTYNYFELQSSKKLMFDNIQIKPKKAQSAYTSPTNIGFSMLSDICAYHLNLIEKDDLQQKLLNKLLTAKDLKKLNGNFYNWYNVEANLPAEPYYVSAVDNGNILACLVVVKECIKNLSLFGIDIVSSLINEMQLDFFIDRTKNLFYVGYNESTNTFESHFDLLASEARILYYLYACKNKNSEPWNNLSRDCVGYNGNTLVSWTGTAFEYLLPTLFLRAPKNSLLYQTENNIVKLAKNNKCYGMWGISESGYYKFDCDLNYQYYAFGLNQVAIKNSPNLCVISPYSSALALKIDEKNAIENLKIIAREGGVGEFGFYEAIDVTSRKHIIYQYMSHHQGMILCAITNLLCDNVINDYFEQNKKVQANKILLSEPKSIEKSFKKPKQDFVYKKYQDTKYFNTDNQSFGVLTNGKYSLFCDEMGNNLACMNGINIAKYFDNFDEFGFKNFLVDKSKNQTIEFYKGSSKDYFEFYKDVYQIKYSNITKNATEEIFLPHCINGEIRKFSILSNESANLIARGYGEPALLSSEEYIAHPAFKDLFLSSFKYDKNTVIFTRKASVNKFVAIKILGLDELVFETNKSNVCNIFDKNINFDFEEKDTSFGDVVYPFFCYHGNLNVKKNKNYYQIIVYAENYEQLQNQLNLVNDEESINNLIYSAKIQSLCKLNDFLKCNTDFDFLTKLSYKIKYNYSCDHTLKIKDQLITTNDEITKICNIASKIIYFDSKDQELFKLLLNCLSIIKSLYKKFVILYFSDQNLNEIANNYPNLIVVAMQDEKLKNIAKQIAFCNINSEFITSKERYLEKNIKSIVSEQIEYPNIISNDFYGGFNSKCYVLKEKTQKPFSNVVCGKYGGFISTNNGENYTYFGNSQKEKTTEWRGECYSKINSEVLTIKYDEEEWQINKYVTNSYVEYFKGKIVFNLKNKNIFTKCENRLLFDGKVKTFVCNINNQNNYPATLELNLYLKIALSINSCRENLILTTQNNILQIKNLTSEKTVFIKILNGEMYARFLPNKQIKISIKANVRQNSSKKIAILMSCDKNLLLSDNESNFYYEMDKQINYFENLNKIKINTKNQSLNILFNDVLLYQTVSARLNGKCGYYQVGGAIGFRDQLQDCLAYLYSDPQYVKQHILTCATKQFIKGDVLHWWHGKSCGVRTKISDDKLFLPYLIAEYIKITGDSQILKENLPYLDGAELSENQNDYYDNFRQSSFCEPLYDHAIRAFKNGLNYGEHNLLLIGGGDWNDALNAIGDNRSGESVWLSMFCIFVIKQFYPFAKEKDKEFFDEHLRKLKNAVNDAWNGVWYKRAYTKNKEWLGNPDSIYCKIDLICQAWAVICEECDIENAKNALIQAEQLVDYKNNIVKLLSPPFENKKLYGYISNYPKGVRENGGQYTHGVTWYIKALSKTNPEQAYKILNMINPINLAKTNKNYKNEPFALSADVYTNGEGGWSWYTGSSAWLYKVILKDILGINLSYQKIVVTPSKIDELDNYECDILFNNYQINLKIAKSKQNKFVVNGKTISNTKGFEFNFEKDISQYEIIVEHE